jgi:hypothetical protein
VRARRRGPAGVRFGLSRFALAGAVGDRFRLGGGFGDGGFTGFFFSALTVFRLRRSASIRSTTFGGSCTSVATISSPAILASMMLRRPSLYSSW